MNATIVARALTAADWPAVEAIYREGIATGHATFEAAPPTWAIFDAGRIPELRFVAVDDAGEILGWAAASPTSAREVYRGVVEHSVYVRGEARGRGVGRLVLQALLAGADTAGYWTVQSSIFPENTASLALHESEGFRIVGIRERIAQVTYGPLSGRWRDTVLVERRSARAAADTDLTRPFPPGDTPTMTDDIVDEEIVRQVADALAKKHPQASRAELDVIVREELAALSGRPVQAYLSILTERAARKRLKKAGKPSD